MAIQSYVEEFPSHDSTIVHVTPLAQFHHSVWSELAPMQGEFEDRNECDDDDDEGGEYLGPVDADSYLQELLDKTKDESIKALLRWMAPCFNMTLADAAVQLGVCVKKLQALRKRAGMTGWPYRQLHSVDNAIDLMKAAEGEHHATMQLLKRKRKELARASTAKLDDETKKIRNALLKDKSYKKIKKEYHAGSSKESGEKEDNYDASFFDPPQMEFYRAILAYEGELEHLLGASVNEVTIDEPEVDQQLSDVYFNVDLRESLVLDKEDSLAVNGDLVIDPSLHCSDLEFLKCDPAADPCLICIFDEVHNRSAEPLIDSSINCFEDVHAVVGGDGLYPSLDQMIDLYSVTGEAVMDPNVNFFEGVPYLAGESVIPPYVEGVHGMVGESSVDPYMTMLGGGLGVGWEFGAYPDMLLYEGVPMVDGEYRMDPSLIQVQHVDGVVAQPVVEEPEEFVITDYLLVDEGDVEA